MAGAAFAAAATAVTLAAGCLDRPVTPQDPATSNIYVAEIRQTAVDKIDLLFMIDNSISMADKQEILRDAVPVLVRRLVTPVCLDGMDRPTNNNAGPEGCPRGTQPEFSPIKDIHIAIVTSSLGAHGGHVCDPARMGADVSEDDKAYPLGRVRTLPPIPGADTSWNNTGFLAWDPDATNPARARNVPPGVTTQNTLETQFQNMVVLTGEVGCGYEASLEAWYRFLVDPDPPVSVGARLNGNGDPEETVANYAPSTISVGGQMVSVVGDPTILDLRAKFLRPDSLVAIVMLTDENDCSIRDEGQSWLVGLLTYNGMTFQMPRATSLCATNPNDPCCGSCASTIAGCAPDPACADPSKIPLEPVNDNLNLRCYNQRQRFGFDLLQPLSRYIDGLTQPILRRDPRAVAVDTDKSDVKANPLFEKSQRDKSLVFLAGIIGVPWQDVSTPESWPAAAPLEYMPYEDLSALGRLDWILGPKAGGPPLDALMYETPLDRTMIAGLAQTHPGTMDRLAVGGMGAPSSNPINGKESTIADNSDLQYACIFPLNEPKMNCQNMQASCDCRPVDAMYNRALCNGTTQTHAKAYPGVRELQVLRGFGDLTQNAIIASICPKVSQRARMNDASYGYTPAVSAIIERLKEALRGKCLPRPLTQCDCKPTPQDDCSMANSPCQGDQEVGNVPCSVIEAKLREGGVCPACTGNPLLLGRLDPKPEIRPAVQRQLQDQEYCGVAGKPSCEEFCLCEIQQFKDQELAECQTEVTTPTDIYGYCYIDPATAPSDAARTAAQQIVLNCPQTQQRLLRFAGSDVPTKGAIALIACLGANVQSN